MKKNYRILNSQIRVASEIWEEISNSPQPADRWLGNYFHKHRKRYGSRDRRFLAEVIYACFRHKTYLEAWCDYFDRKEQEPLSEEIMPLLASILADLFEVEDFEQLSLKRNLTKVLVKYYDLIRAYKLPNDLKLEGDEVISTLHSCPIWLVKRWKESFGDSLTKVLSSQNQRPPFMIRVNGLKTTQESLSSLFKEQGHEVQSTNFSSSGILFKERANLFSSEEFKKGFFEVQDEGSQLVCEIVDPQPGEIIWDVCAGAGGKSLALAVMMKNKGRIIATDIRMKKLEDLKKRAKRAGAHNIFPADLNRLDETKAMKKGVDRILVDAPCSGSGTFRRNPDAKWKLKPEDMAAFAQQQFDILSTSLPHLKEGGFLYYVTCSLDPEENEQVVQRVLEKYSFLEKVPLVSTPVGSRHGLSIQSQEGFLRLWPHEHGTDGFFLAILRKKVRI